MVNRIIINVLLLIILIVAIAIYYSQITFTRKESFANTSYIDEQNLPNAKFRDCSVYFVEDTNRCDSYSEFYNMSELELRQYIIKNPQHNHISILNEILNEKKDNDTICKLNYNGWKEIESYTDEYQTYQYPLKNATNTSNNVNFKLMNNCFLNEGATNELSFSDENTSVIKGHNVFNNDSIIFNNLTKENLLKSVCDNFTPPIGNLFINDKYFFEIKCSYNNLQDSIQIQNIQFKKATNNNIIDITDDEKNKILRPYFNKHFPVTYSQSSGIRKVPIITNIGSYTFHYDMCNTLISTDYENVANFSLKDFGINSIPSGISNNDLFNELNKTNTVRSYDEIIRVIDATVKKYTNQITSKENNITELQNSNSEILSQSTEIDTTQIVRQTNTQENINNILSLRFNTDSKIQQYNNAIIQIHNNKVKESFDIDVANDSNRNLAKELQTAIDLEYSGTSENIQSLNKSFIKEIQNSFSPNLYTKISIYDKNPDIKNTEELSNFLNCNAPIASSEGIFESMEAPTYDSNIGKSYLLEIVGNVNLNEGNYKFFFDRMYENEKLDAFISHTTYFDNRAYQKVSYIYDDKSNLIKYKLNLSKNKNTYSFEKKQKPYKLYVKFENAVHDYNNYSKNKFELLGSDDNTNWNMIMSHQSIPYTVINTPPQEDITDGLQAWYKFENNFLDSSGNNNHIYYNNGDYASIHEERRRGEYCLALRNAFLDSDTKNINFNATFSVCFWIYRISMNDQFTVIAMGNVNDVRKALHIGFRASNQIMFAFYADDLDTSTTYNEDKDKWVHLAFTFNSSNRERKIYRNGVNVATDNAKGNPQFNAGTFRIGAQYYGPYISANIQDIRIYSKVLTPGEIQNIFNNQGKNTLTIKYEKEIYQYEDFKAYSGTEESLEVWYKFDGDFKNHVNSNYNLIRYDEYNLAFVDDNKKGEKSLQFNGGYLSIQDLDISSFTNGITIATWFKLNEPPENSHYTRIIDFGYGPGNNNIVISRYSTTHKIIIHVFKGNESHHALTKKECLFNAWTHIAVTFSNDNNDKTTSTWKLYINGVLQELDIASNNGTIWPLSLLSSAKCYIGYSHWGTQSDPVFKGNMDDFRIYSKVLSEIDINTLIGKIKKYPPLPIVSRSAEDNTRESNGYQIDWSSDYGWWRPPHFFGGVNKSTETGGGHPRAHFNNGKTSYNTNTGILHSVTNLPFIKPDYQGEWVLLKLPKQIYLYNIKIYQRIGFEKRAPIDYKIYARNNNRGEWKELLHEQYAIYKFHEHSSELILSDEPYDTYALCVKKIDKWDGNSYILNFDELEFYGSEEPFQKIEPPSYKYFKVNSDWIDQVTINNEQSNLNIELLTSTVSGYSTDKPVYIPRKNNGYYGIYMRCLRKIENISKPKPILKYIKYDTNDALSIDQTWLESSYSLVNNQLLANSSSTDIVNNIIILNTLPETIFENKQDKTICSNYQPSPSIPPAFYINCPKMPSITSLVNNKPAIIYTNVQKPTLINVQNPTYPNTENIKNAINAIKAFRDIELNHFDCIVNNDEKVKSLKGDISISVTDSSASGERAKQIQMNNEAINNFNQEINIINIDISTYNKLKADLQKFKNEDESQYIFNQLIKTKEMLDYNKYIKTLSRIPKISQSAYYEYYIYLLIDNTLSVLNT